MPNYYGGTGIWSKTIFVVVVVVIVLLAFAVQGVALTIKEALVLQ